MKKKKYEEKTMKNQEQINSIDIFEFYYEHEQPWAHAIFASGHWFFVLIIRFNSQQNIMIIVILIRWKWFNELLLFSLLFFDLFIFFFKLHIW